MGKICPKCGNELSDGARFCSKCGSKYEEVATVKDNKCKCSKCGNELKIGMKFCTKCGTPMDDLEKAGQDVNVVEKSKEFTGDVKNFKALPKKRKKKVAIIIGIIVAALFLMFSCVGGDEDERGIDKNTFEKRFCEDIGETYEATAWSDVESEQGYKTDMYTNGNSLAIYLSYTDDNEVIGAIILADMDYLNIDEEFEWKRAAVSAMLGCDIEEADSIMRDANSSGAESIDLGNNIELIPYVDQGNVAQFIIRNNDYR